MYDEDAKTLIVATDKIALPVSFDIFRRTTRSRKSLHVRELQVAHQAFCHGRSGCDPLAKLMISPRSYSIPSVATHTVKLKRAFLPLRTESDPANRTDSPNNLELKDDLISWPAVMLTAIHEFKPQYSQAEIIHSQLVSEILAFAHLTTFNSDFYFSEPDLKPNYLELKKHN